MKDDLVEDLHPITRVVADMARAICYHPQDFKVFEDRTIPHRITVKLSPNMADIRLLIGAQGRQSKAFDFLVSTMAVRWGFAGGKCILEESYVGSREERWPIEFNDAFTAVELTNSLVPVANLALGDMPEITVETKPDPDRPPRGMMHCVYIDVPEEQTSTVAAIGDIAFVLGRRNGWKVKTKTLNSKFANEQRKRAGVA